MLFLLFNIKASPKSKYKEGNHTIQGIVKQCHQKDGYVQLILDNDEKIIGNYYNNFKCKLGIKVKVTGEINKPKTNTIFNSFNYRNYLLSKKIKYQIKISKIKITDNKTNNIYKIKNNLIKKINNYQSKDYMNAFILGDTSSIDEEVYASYQTNGVNHLLAISGMHISLIALALLFILNKISKDKIVNYTLVIITLLFYAFLTNFSPSIMRAIFMFILLTINKNLNLKISSIYILLLICSLYFFYNPFIVYNIGFLYSFIITAHLIVFNKLINNEKNYLKKTLIISVIAFVSSVPITIINFHSLNLLTPLINIIFVPFVSYIVYPLSLITLFIPPLDPLLSKTIYLTENLSLLISKIDVLILTLRHINILVVFLYYILVFITLTNLKKYYPVFIIVLCIHNCINYLDKYPEIIMIDVGQADSILIKLPHNKGNILIDAGGNVDFKNNSVRDLSKNKIIPYLKSEGIRYIDYLIITHGDTDHIGSVFNLIKNYKVKNIFINSNKDNEYEKKLIKTFKKVKKINDGVLKIDKYKFKFLKSKNQTTENNDSLIVYTELNGKNILLMGDAEEEREKQIMNEYNLPKMDILKVGHHGSKSSSSSEFINHIRPKISLISAGLNNLYGHPHKETLKNLQNSKILITQIDGSIKLKLKKRIIYSTCPLQR